jgi:hypothetical protein
MEQIPPWEANSYSACQWSLPWARCIQSIPSHTFP